MTRFLAALAAFVLVVVPAAAVDKVKPLTESEIDNFISAMPATQEVGEKMQAEGVEIDWVDQMAPKAGEEFRPYSKSLSVLKEEQPARVKELSSAVKPHGFSSAEDWAETGDKAMKAYIAVTMERENPQGFQMPAEMTPEMLAMVPPQMRAQIEAAMAMMAAVEATPEPDRVAMRKKYDSFDAAIDAMAAAE